MGNYKQEIENVVPVEVSRRIRRRTRRCLCEKLEANDSHDTLKSITGGVK
jgi:hypothetical protein